MKRPILAVVAIAVIAAALSACTPSPSTSAQVDCQTADAILPALRDAREGRLSDAELRSAEAELRKVINERLSDPDGQVGAMLYVLGAPVWSDKAGLEGTHEEWASFKRQLLSYCSDIAGWPLSEHEPES